MWKQSLGPTRTLVQDAGALDAGVLDARALDAGSLDAGVLDAGVDLSFSWGCRSRALVSRAAEANIL